MEGRGRGRKKDGNRKRDHERERGGHEKQWPCEKLHCQLRKPSYRILLQTIISNLGQFYSPHVAGDMTYPMQGG